MTLLDEGETTCCYARSQKHWVTDPQGIAWEHFHTLADLPVFREDTAQAATGSACCAPTQAEAVASADAATCCASPPRGKAMGMLIKSSASCC
jgi:lactoylglutathione lyase